MYFTLLSQLVHCLLITEAVRGLLEIRKFEYDNAVRLEIFLATANEKDTFSLLLMMLLKWNCTRICRIRGFSVLTIILLNFVTSSKLAVESTTRQITIDLHVF